jgi:hypothetical protein
MIHFLLIRTGRNQREFGGINMKNPTEDGPFHKFKYVLHIKKKIVSGNNIDYVDIVIKILLFLYVSGLCYGHSLIYTNLLLLLALFV